MVKDTMATLTAQMQTDTPAGPSRRCLQRRRAGRPAHALVLIELIVVISMLALLVSITAVNLTGSVFRTRFDRQAHDFMTALKMAQDFAAQSNTRYAVLIDIDERTYTLKPFYEIFEGTPVEEQPIATGCFTDDFQLEYVRFDDGQDTRNVESNAQEIYRIWLMTGQSGWQNGAHIGLLDDDGNPYTVVMNRLNRTITMHPGELEMLEPLDELPF